MENKIKQLRKGILELAIMGALEHHAHYGYSLIRHLTDGDGADLTEGTIYPILNRLSREGLVSADWVESRQGPPRKYYTLTSKGKKASRVLRRELNRLFELVRRAGDPPEGSTGDRAGTRIVFKKERDHVA